MATAAAKMHGRGGADRPERIVRHHVDIVRLAPAGDLHRLGEAADIADVDAVELVDAALDVGQELPLGGELLADGEGDVGHRAQRLVGLRRLVADRLLEEVERAAADLLAEARGLGDRQAMVVVDAEDDVVAERLARLDAPFSRSRRSARAARRCRLLSCPAGKKRIAFQPVRRQLAWPARSSSPSASSPVEAKVGMRSRCLPPSSS